MKGYKALLLTAGLSTLLLAGCQNYDHLIPDDFDVILSLKQTGELKTTLYTTGEDGVVDLTIYKGGSDPSKGASAELSVLSPAELAQYAEQTGVTYTALPSEAYVISEPMIAINPDSGYVKRQVTLKTTAIQEIMEAQPDVNYAVPLLLTSATDSVSADRNIVVLKPELLVPTLGYELTQKSLNVAAGETEYDLRLTLPFASLWDFEITLAVAPDLLPAQATLIREGEYTLANDGKVTFKQGSITSEPLKITIKETSDRLIGNRNALPLYVAETTMTGLGLPEGAFTLYATEYNRIPLSAAMLSTNAQEQSEGPIGNLVDGNPDTYFHSSWQNPGVSGGQPHNIVVTLKEPITRVSFKYQNRGNTNGKAQDIKLYVFDTEWRELGEISDGLPVGSGSIYSSPTFEAERPFTKFRMDVLKTAAGSAPVFFNMAELYLYGK